MSSAPVVIIGAGPVGILNALGLARAGVEVVVLERNDQPGDAPRAMVYHWTALAGLADLGVLDAAIEAGFTKQDYAWHVASTGETIHFSIAPVADLTPYPFNLHLGQDRLVRIALAELDRLPNAEVHFGWELDHIRQSDSQVTVTSTERTGSVEVRGSYLIGADGAGSAVRKALGLSFDGMTWDQRFVATDIRYDFRSLGFARSTMVVDPEIGAIVVLAEDDGGVGLWRYTFAEDLALPVAEVEARAHQRLAEALPDGGSAEIVRFSPYRMHQRSAPTMRSGRVILAGDAGHATNPTGGLGLTSGLFDTYALYPALAAVVCGEVSDSVLDRYSEERLRIFRERTSPAAVENKRLVFDGDDPGRLAQDIDALRRQVADPDTLRERLRFTETLMTPSLLTPNLARPPTQAWASGRSRTRTSHQV